MSKTKMPNNFYEELPVAIYRTRLDDGMFLYINEYGAKMLGYDSSEDVINKLKSSEIYCNGKRGDIVEKLKEFGEVVDFEICLELPQKGKVWVCATAKLRGDVIEGSLTNITKRKETESESKNAINEIYNKIQKKLSHYDRVSA